MFFLTFQSAAETVLLSESVRSFLGKLGIEVGSKALRHLVHVPLFFLLAVVVMFCGRVIGLGLRGSVFICLAVGVLDELVKFPLPTREFDPLDLLLDIVGIMLAAGMCLLFGIATKKID